MSAERPLKPEEVSSLLDGLLGKHATRVDPAKKVSVADLFESKSSKTKDKK